MLTSRRIAGIGSREYPRLSDVARYVEVIPRDVPIITGGWWTHDGLAQPTRGVDRVVALTAAKDHVVILVMGPVGAGVRAGLLRNPVVTELATEVVAWWDGRSTGTPSTIRHARRQQKPVVLYGPDGEEVPQ